MSSKLCEKMDKIIGAWKCNFPTKWTNQPIDGCTDRVILGSFTSNKRFQAMNEKGKRFQAQNN